LVHKCSAKIRKSADDYIKSKHEEEKGSHWMSHRSKSSYIGHCGEQYL